MSHFLPHVNYTEGGTSRSADPFSFMLSHRAIFLSTDVNNVSASSIVAQLFSLEKQNKKPIDFYINSPGGVVTEGLAIYDAMRYIESPVNTICLGEACSMGSFLLAGGTGKRLISENSRVMIHQVLGGFSGQESDVKIHAAEMARMKDQLNRIIAKNSGNDFETVEAACDRDNFLQPKQALEFGLVDEIIVPTHI